MWPLYEPSCLWKICGSINLWIFNEGTFISLITASAIGSDFWVSKRKAVKSSWFSLSSSPATIESFPPPIPSRERFFRGQASGEIFIAEEGNFASFLDLFYFDSKIRQDHYGKRLSKIGLLFVEFLRKFYARGNVKFVITDSGG